MYKPIQAKNTDNPKLDVHQMVGTQMVADSLLDRS